MNLVRERYISVEPQVPVSSLIEVPGLTSEIRGKNGKIVLESNWEEKLDSIEEEFTKRPWIQRLIDDVRSNKRVAQAVPILGGIIIFAAVAGIGIELRNRGGKNLKDLHDLINKIRHPKTEK